MALKNRVRTAMPETHSHRHTQSFWLYRLEGLLLAAAPIVAVAGVIAVQAGQPAGQVVLLCALAMFGLVALRYWVLASAMDRVFNAAYAAGLRMRSGLLQHLTRLPMGRFRTLHTGKVAQILSEDITWIETWVSHHWPMSQSDTLLMLTLLVGAAVLNPAMAVAAVLTFAVGMAVLWYFEKHVLTRGMQYRSVGLAEASRHIIEFAEGMSVVRAFGDTDEAERDYHKSVEIMREGFARGVKRNTPLAGLYLGLSMASVGVGALVGVATLAELDADATVRFFAALVLLTATLVPARAMLGHRLMGVMSRLGDENITAVEQMAALRSGERRDIPSHGEVRFEGVNFAYDEGKPVIHAANFSAPAGSLTAIVGGSGAGKTTLMNVLLRFWDIEQGRISIDNVDIRDFAIDAWMNRIAVVFQETQLFRDTVANNIRIGKPDATQAEIEAAAQKARIHERILALPDGYETLVGHGGSTLSGGERQRVTIARALLKDADIVILDEATSALDPENEHSLQMAFAELARDKTVFVIAHRLSTVVDADTILLMDEGRIVDQGTHDALIARSALYQKLWESYTAISDWQL